MVTKIDVPSYNRAVQDCIDLLVKTRQDFEEILERTSKLRGNAPSTPVSARDEYTLKEKISLLTGQAGHLELMKKP